MARRQQFRIQEFSGGYSTERSEHLLEDNQASDILNFRLDKLGSLVSRRGYSKLITTPHVESILALGRWSPANPDDSHHVLGVSPTQLVLVDSAGDAYTTLATLDAPTERPQLLPLEDTLIAVTGSTTPLVYDGADVYPLGLPEPAAPTLTDLSTGSLAAGTYGYVYTLYSSATGYESNPSEAAEVTVLGSDSVEVEMAVPAGYDSYVDAFRVYRLDPGAGQYLLLAEVAVSGGATTTYTDDGTAALAPIAADYDNGIAPNFERMAYYAGYAFGSVGDTLYWSKPLAPGAWPELSYTQVPFEGNDTIVALVAHQDALVIFGRRNTLLLAGSGGAWSLSRLDVALGAASPDAVIETPAGLFFLSYAGIRTFPGMAALPALERDFSLLSPAELEGAAACYVPEERAVWFRVGDFTYTIHLPNQAVSRYSFAPTCFLTGGQDGASFPIFAVDADAHEYGGVTDNGSAIPVQWSSKTFALTPEAVKHFRRIGAYASRGSGAAVTITIRDQTRSYSVALQTASTSEEELIWDEGDWAADAAAEGDPGAEWAQEGVAYFIGALPAQTLLGHTFKVDVSAEVSAETEIIPPITFEYRESQRFLGA